MNAQEIAAMLGDASREGRGWRCRCPIHGGASLVVCDGAGGRVLVKCWGGCATRILLRKLRRLGLLGEEVPAPITPEEIERRKAATDRHRRHLIARGAELWDEAGEIRDTLADRYLRQRGLDLLSPYIDPAAATALRFHPHCWHSPGVWRSALLARIDHVERGFCGVSATYLRVDGLGKSTLDPPRKFWAASKGAAVRLAPVDPDRELVIAEGVETALSLMLACRLGAWSALSADGIRSLELPATARLVLIAADNDCHGVGKAAAEAAAERWLAEGRRVRIAVPPDANTDFNDMLAGNMPARALGAA